MCMFFFWFWILIGLIQMCVMWGIGPGKQLNLWLNIYLWCRRVCVCVCFELLFADDLQFAQFFFSSTFSFYFICFSMENV